MAKAYSKYAIGRIQNKQYTFLIQNTKTMTNL